MVRGNQGRSLSRMVGLTLRKYAMACVASLFNMSELLPHRKSADVSQRLKCQQECEMGGKGPVLSQIITIKI